MNSNIKKMLLSETLYVGSTGLFLPLMAIFITSNILYGNIINAGIGITIYTLTKSIIRIPLSAYCDGKNLHKMFMITGYLIMAVVPLGYYFMHRIYQYYALQVLYGVGAAIGRAGWYGIFNMYIDKNRGAYTWSVMQTGTGLSEAITVALGGIMVTFAGFNSLFLLVTAMGVLSTIVLIKIEI